MMKTKSNQTENAPKPFDMASEEDAKELKTWCRLHFQHTLCKGVQGANTPMYHDCCMAFTKRGCIKRLSHPPLQSASVLKIPSLRKADSPEDLYEWLRGRMLIHHSLGQKIYFPSINTAHFSLEEEEAEEDQQESPEFLGKRVEQLTEELLKTEQELTQLREENNRLQSSSRNWYDKYQELLLRVDGDKPSYAEITPKKYLVSKETLTNEDFLDL
jgi:hypothetical protein